MSKNNIGCIQLIFFPQLNQKIRDEAFIYKDILLENFYESYHNLTIKSMMLIKFVASASVKSKFVFKVSFSMGPEVEFLVS
jgi:beta-1,3-galactosyltransferase 1